MFGVNGERDLTERELPHLTGWRDSRPVRVGNGAWNQRQLDVYGELLSALHRLREQVGALTPATAGFLMDVAEAAFRRWREPDHGIWEIREEPRHFLHSKLMCWVALDRAVELSGSIGADPDRVTRWRKEREQGSCPRTIPESARRWKRLPSGSPMPAAWTNDLGLLAEEVDGATRELLGNFPQAFSHVGLVNAAWTIAQAEAGRAEPATVALR
jgi:GH15 family glucan-1,4-alpha-glucosidase